MTQAPALQPAQPEKSKLKLGYLRLTDAAPLIAAFELGYFEEAGLLVTLCQEISWANARDKLTVGSLDAAQMLAPLPAMSTLGVSGIRVPILTGLTLSLNGNAITLSQPLWEECEAEVSSGRSASTRCALAKLVSDRPHPLTFATVHAFSTHTVLLRRWLRKSNLDPDVDVRMIVVPPAQMVDSLESGVIDGFCVGEPWNTVAVNRGLGTIATSGADIWPAAPEKVLAVSEAWHRDHPNTHLRLRLALLRACSWLASRDNAGEAAAMLSRSTYLDMPESHILPSLDGFHLFHGERVNRPQVDAMVTLINECAEMIGKPLEDPLALSRQVCRPELYDDTLPYLKAFSAIPAPK